MSEIYLERLNAPSLDSEYYKPSGTFNTSPAYSDVQMPNCVMYCYCRAFEACRSTEPFPIARNSLGFGNAKTWYANSPLQKGSSIRNGSIACFDGNYGHVAFVERKIDDTHALISESQYDDDKSLRNYKFWQKRIVELKVGKSTLSGVGALQGFLYLPIHDFRTKYTGNNQIEIIEDFVNVRNAPEGSISLKGCYCPRGIFNVLEKRNLNGYDWFKIDENAWIRSGEWLIYHSNSDLEELRKENKELRADLQKVLDIVKKYASN